MSNVVQYLYRKTPFAVLPTPNGSMLKGLAHMDTLSKICCRCNIEKPLSEFYIRKGSSTPVSECKICMKERAKHRPASNNRNYLIPRAETEKLAISYLHRNGIPALPGKALRHSHVDVIAFGCVDIEVKYSRLEYRRGTQQFTFNATPSQKSDGFRAEIVMLICNYGDRLTHHFFDVANAVFYINGRTKTGFTFTPGNYEPLKHSNNRVVMVQGMMDAAQDKTELIYAKLQDYCQWIKEGA